MDFKVAFHDLVNWIMAIPDLKLLSTHKFGSFKNQFNEAYKALIIANQNVEIGKNNFPLVFYELTATAL